MIINAIDNVMRMWRKVLISLFFILMIDDISSMESAHSKISHAISLSRQAIFSVSRHTISPI